MIDIGVKEISQLEMKDIFNSNFYGERLKNFNQVLSKQTLIMKKQITTDKGRTVNMFYFN